MDIKIIRSPRKFMESKLNFICRYFLIIIFLNVAISSEKKYFQQHVEYDIEVTLNDSTHSLHAYEKIVYTNNSPDTLYYIWFHLWPNAYKNLETAFAKQKKRFFDTRFIFSEEKDRGYIDSLNFKINGKIAETEFHEQWIDVMKLKLLNPLLPKEKITIETPFYVKLPKIYSRLGHTGKHYEITQWYPKPAVYDNRGWHPMPYLDMGEFYSEFGSFNVKISLPENYRIMATGDLVNGDKEYLWLDSLASLGDSLHSLDKKEFKIALKELKNPKKNKYNILKKIQKIFNSKEEDLVVKKTKMKTVQFYQDNVHDFAWFADPNWIVRKGSLELDGRDDKITLWSMYLPKNAELWENSIEYLHDSGFWFSKFNGDYPYNHITAVDGDLSAGGGMEYPNITVISEMDSKHLLEMVIMHEVGHNWFYGILGSNERDHTWMDEGLNEFCNIRYWDKKYGNDNMRYVVNDFIQNKLGPFSIANNLKFGFFEYTGYTSWIKLGDEEKLETSSNDFKRRANYWLSYSKPMVYSWHLLHYLGEEKINNILQGYYTDWKFKHPYPSDFFKYVKKYSGKNVDWYTSDLFYSTGHIDYSVIIKDNYAIFKNNGSLTVPFEVAYYNKNKDEISRQWFENVEDQKSIKLDKEIKSVIIDPSQTLPDINRYNNSTSKPINFTWIFDQPKHHTHEIFWMPWLFDYNQYNGWTPGIKFSNGFLSQYDYNIEFKPMMDYTNNNIIGSIAYTKKFYKIFNSYLSQIKFKYDKFYGRNGLRINFEGKYKEHLKRYPVLSTSLNLNYHGFSSAVLDTSYYEIENQSNIYTEIEYINRPSALLRYNITAGLKKSILNAKYTKVHLRGNIQYKFTKKIQPKLRMWLGGFLNSANIPKQYLIYLSSGVDPDFTNNYILNRTSIQNDLSMGLKQYNLSGGPSVYGVILDGNNRLKAVDNWLLSLSLESRLPKTRGKFFIDTMFIINDNIYYDFGWKASKGPITLIIPIFQSWDQNQFNNNDQLDLLIKRIRFTIDIPDLSGNFL